MNKSTDETAAMDRHDEPYKSQLQRIGQAIGYGRAQQLLGDLWDATLHADYGVASNRGRMGVTIDDALPPIPKATKLRRQISSHGGYQMVPAYTVAEMKAFAHAALSKQPAGEGEK